MLLSNGAKMNSQICVCSSSQKCDMGVHSGEVTASSRCDVPGCAWASLTKILGMQQRCWQCCLIQTPLLCSSECWRSSRRALLAAWGRAEGRWQGNDGDTSPGWCTMLTHGTAVQGGSCCTVYGGCGVCPSHICGFVPS